MRSLHCPALVLPAILGLCASTQAQNLIPAPTAGTNGAVIVDIAGGFDDMIRHALLPDGKLLLGGWGNDLACNCNHIALMRIDTLCAGLDPEFGNGGTISHIFGQRSMMLDMAVLPDGRILGVGQNAFSDSLSSQVNAIYRFNPDGTPDLTLNGTAWRTDRFDAVSSGIHHGVLPLADGRFYAVGNSIPNINGGARGLGMMRYLEDGSLDPTFSGDGKAWVAMTPPLANIGGHAALLMPDSAVLWIGFGQVAGQPRVVHFAKFDSTGVLDSSFGTNGQLTTTLQVSDNNQQRIRAEMLPDGRFMISARSLDNRFLMARFLEDGTLDTSYGVAGISLVDPTPSTDSPYGVQLLADGSTVQTGGQNAATGYSMVKRDANGAVVTTFGNNGILSIPLLSPNTQAIYGGLMLSDHTAMAYGAATTTVPSALVIKLTSDPTIGTFADLGPDVIACAGSEVVLDAGFPGSTYLWTVSNGPATGTAQTYTATSTAAYRVTITNTLGCTDRDTVQVQFVPPPTMPVIIQDGTVLYTLSSEGLQWYLDGEAIPGATGEFHTPTENGSYTVSTTNSAGCTSISAPITILTVGVTAHEPHAVAVTVAPNPTRDHITIHVGTGSSALRFTLLDALGREVLRLGLPQGTTRHELDLSQLGNGTYLLQVQDEHAQAVEHLRIVKQ